MKRQGGGMKMTHWKRDYMYSLFTILNNKIQRITVVIMKLSKYKYLGNHVVGFNLCESIKGISLMYVYNNRV